jgi:uncharacterized repeat protein (TIGR01451 family)
MFFTRSKEQALKHHQSSRQQSPGQARFRPRLEGLEERVVLNNTDLSVVGTATGILQAGHTITYTFTVVNNGPDATSGGPTVTTTLPANLTFASGTSTSGTVTPSAGTVTTTLGALAPGASATITITATSSAASTGTLTTTSTVAAAAGDTDPFAGNNAATVNTLVANGPVTPNQCYVANLFQTVLGRPGDQATINAMASLIDMVGVNRFQLAQYFVTSLEYRVNLVQNLYSRLLHRPAEPSAVALGTNFLAQGGTDQQLAALIVSSPEYFVTRGGGTNLGFLQAAYLDLLGRPIDPAGQQAFLFALNTGTPRLQIASNLLKSLEGNQFVTNQLYLHYLNRPADPLGLAAFSRSLQSGQFNAVANASASASAVRNVGINTGEGLTVEGVSVDLVSSPEFFANLSC